MREFRMSKTDKEHYTSFAEAAKAWGCKEVKKKRSSDPQKLEKDREKFVRTCPVCKQLMNYDGGNVVVCKNERCTGIKKEFENEDGTKRIEYYPVFRLLDEVGSDIAYNLFD